MKIVLVIPQRSYLTNQTALPNLGILTVASVAKKLGCQVEVYDLGDSNWMDTPFLPIDKNAIYGMYVTTPDYQTCLKTMKFLRSEGATKVIAGGPHVSFNPSGCLKDGFNAVSVGNAEVTLPKILQGETLAYGWLSSRVEAAHPDRTIIDLKKYDFKVDGVPATSMMTSIGCAWGQCVFCSKPPDMFLRYHSVSWVLDELNEIEKLGFKAVQVYDDEFFTYPKRDIAIIRAFGRRGLTWRCFGHSKFLHAYEPLVEEASENGLREILVGIESGSDKILNVINKGTTVFLNKKVIKTLHSLGIKVKCAMIIGLPSESPETLKETWQFCEEMQPYVSDWDFTVFSSYPGSEVYNHPEKFDIKFTKDKFTAFKGSANIDWNRSDVSTKRLKNQTILQLRDQFEKQFKH